MKKNTLVMKIDEESMLIRVVCLLILGLYIRNASYVLSIFSANTKQIIYILIKGVILVAIIACVPVIIHRLSVGFTIVVICSVLFILLHILLFEDNNKIFLDTVNTFVTTILPGVICVYFIRDYVGLFNKFIIVATIISLINIGVFVLLVAGMFSAEGYSMGFSQSLIFPTNILIANLYDKQTVKISSICLIILNALTIILFGSRGALVAIFVFLILMNIKNIHQNKKTIIYKIIMMVLAMLLVILFFNTIIGGLINCFERLGISSRSLELILQHDFFSNNGRIDIWKTIWSELSKHPFQIRGINADQLLRTGFYNTSNYSHNIFLELLYSFGIVFGGGLSIVFGTCFYKTYVGNIASKEQMLKILLLSPFFPLCIWSGSLWTDMYCWLWLALKKK